MLNAADVHHELSQLVTFHLGREIYGIEISQVREILHYHGVQAIPNAPVFIAGVIDLRNQVIPIVDMRRRLGLNGDQPTSRRVVVLDLVGRPLGIIVDDMSQVLLLEPDRFVDLPVEVVLDPESSCISGLAKTEHEGLVIVLAPERVLTRSQKRELAQLEPLEELARDPDGAAP